MAVRNVLFVHTNFPGQFRHIAARLAADPNYKVFAFTSGATSAVKGVTVHAYDRALSAVNDQVVHPFARQFDADCRRAEQIMYLSNVLRASRSEPHVIIAHPGWGEALPIRVLFPRARIATFCEFFYHPRGADVGFDPEFPPMGVDGLVKVHLRNATSLLALTDADLGIAPTKWQRSVFPPQFHSKIRVQHEGIDVDEARPDPQASLTLPNGQTVRAGDEVLTFVARNLEPYRGYHIFMRALPAILRARPAARVLIVGGSGLSYGASSTDGSSWHSTFLNEVRHELDMSRVHFLGHIDRGSYLRVLQVSAAHVYLTYPFVLSWSLLEAMAAECLVIGSDTPPVREVVEHGRNGVLFLFFEPRELAERVVSGLADRTRYAGLRKQARQFAVRNFGVRDVALPKYVNLVRELAG